MDNLGGLTREKDVGAMRQSYTQIFPLVINKLYKTNSCVEQGFYNLPTENRSSYYDYLYIYKSRCETNLSLNWGRA